ncbi:MAG: S1 RNA-binding domain-containing protein [Nitrospirales bacterium]
MSDSNTIVQINQKVKTSVLEVDVPRKRISLSMKAISSKETYSIYE